MNQMRLRVVGGRYELRNASLVDLIRTAWNVQADDVVGGPEWLDSRRFDVSIPVPESSGAEQLRSILQTTLADRFHLAVHNATRNVPVFAITVANKALAAKALATLGSDEGGCRQTGQAAGAVAFECRGVSPAKLAEGLPRMRATGYLFNYRVIERTGLKGSFDFSVKWTPRDSVRPRAATGDTITIFDAFENQLGLKLALSSVSAPAALRFEVATIKPLESPPPCSSVGIEPGGRVHVVMTLKGMIQEAWGDMNPDRLAGGTKRMESTCCEVVAKAPVEEGFGTGWNRPVWNGLDLDSMRKMLRALLVERFRLVAHTGERVVSGYALTAGKPKLRTADPSRRSGCGVVAGRWQGSSDLESARVIATDVPQRNDEAIRVGAIWRVPRGGAGCG